VFHKFKIGQQVEYSPPRGNYAPRGVYLVTKLLKKTPDQAGTRSGAWSGVSSFTTSTGQQYRP